MSIADLPARRPVLAVVALAAITGLALFGWTRERERRTVSSPRAKADHEFNMALEADFGSDGSDVLLLVDVLGRGDLFDREPARAFSFVLEAVRSQPAVVRVVSFDEIPAYGFGLVPLTLFPEADASESKRATCRRRALEHPVVAGNLLSEDARTALVPLVLGVSGREEAARAIGEIEAAVADVAEGSPIRVRLLGRVPVGLAWAAASDSERLRFQVIGYTLVVTLALLLFRGVLTTLVVVAPPVIGLFWTFGVLGFTGEKLSGMSKMVMPIILLMIGFTNAAHLVFQIRRERGAGLGARQAAAAALRKVGLPCLLSALTTAAGFGSLLVAEADLISDFGRDCAIGSLLIFVAVVLVAPLLAITPLGGQLASGPPARGRRAGWVVRFFEDVIGTVLARARTVVWVAVAVTAGCAWLAISTLRPDIFLKSQLPDGSAPAAALVHADSELDGVQVVRIAVDWGDGAGIGEVLEVLGEVEVLVENEPLLSRPLSIRSVLASLPGLGRDLSRRVNLLGRAPPEMVAPLFRPDRRRAVVVTRVQDVGVATYVPVYDRLEERLAALAEVHPDFSFGLAGNAVSWGRYLHRMVNDLARSLGFAVVIILAMIIVAYRSLRVGLIATLPNLFPLLACAAALALLDLPLSLETVCAFTICLGIAADDSIHFLSRYRTERASGLGVDAALSASFMRVGHVLSVTTAVMLCGLGSILFSSLPMYRSFAGVACTTLAVALVADLLVLPALLKVFGRR